MERSDKELVHDAWLEVNSDPDLYNDWQKQFVEDLEFKFKNNLISGLSPKQLRHVKIILEGE